MVDEYCKLLNVSRNTYYVHKREERPIIDLLETYFTKDDLVEFLETGKIDKFEIMNSLNIEAERICEKFFFQEYSKKSKNSWFWRVVFPKFQDVVTANSTRLDINNIKSSMISFIIDFDYLPISYADKKKEDKEEYEKYLQMFKVDTIEILSNLHDAELYVLFNSYKQYINSHPFLFEKLKSDRINN